MQINNDRREDVFVWVNDLNQGGAPEVVRGMIIRAGSAYSVSFINQDGDGNYRIRWRAEDRNGNVVGQGDHNTANGSTVYIR